MKLILFLSLAITFTASASSIYAQKTNLDVKNTTLKDVFKILKSNVDVDFLYAEEDIINAKPVTIKVKNRTLKEVLDMCFTGQPLEYTLNSNNTVLVEKKVKTPDFPKTDIKNNIQQQNQLTGTVRDEEGSPLAGVTVTLKGQTQFGTISDVNGRYTLNTPENSILIFSYVGYLTQEVLVGGEHSIDIVLKSAQADLDEVVVVGYGTQKKVNLTGAVDVISSKQIENRQAPTVSQILQGQSPGLNFSVGSNGLEPGASMNINIRGAGSLNGGRPYVLIDGFPGQMDRLNPEDIESISILKDAAASAIYGARAPYGVILITTKKGRKGEDMSIAYSGNMSVGTPDRLPQMLDSYTFARVMNEMGENGGGRAYSIEGVDRIIAYQKRDWEYLKQFVPADATHYETLAVAGGRWANTNDSHGDYDWYKEYYGHSLNHNHNISVKGGGSTAAYYLSAGYLNQNGVLNYGVDTYQRYNLNGKVNISIKDWWDVRYETRFMKSPRERFNSENGSTTVGYDLLFRQITRTVPTQAKYDPYGNYSMISKIPSITERGTDRIETTDNWQTFATELRPLNGWKINMDFAYNSVSTDRSNRNFTLYEPYSDGRIVPLSFTVPNRIQQTSHNNYFWATNLYTSYDWRINNDNHLYFMLGTQYEYDKTHSVSVDKTGLVIESVPSLQTANGDVSASESIMNWATQGYFSRFMYNYKEKYLFEANARYDGTSRFSNQKRWGFFPSFSVGWNLDKEHFWEPVKAYINNLKIRASWGQLGNQQVSPYQDLALIPLNTGKLSWIFKYGDNRPIGYTGTPSLVSPNLTWETATTKNLGLNLSFLETKLNADFDLYERVTQNMIGPSEPLSGVLGVSVPSSNNSTLRTRGWELSLRWQQALVAKNLSYFFTVNVHDARSFIVKYRNPSGIVSDWYAGKEMGEIWGFTANKLYQSQEEVDTYLKDVDMSNIFNSWSAGDVKYEDINGDNKVDRGANTITNPGDLSIIGNNTARYQYGISGGVTFRSFDFSFLIRGTAKRDYFFATGSNNIRYWGVNTIYFTGMTPQHLDYFRDQEGDKYSGLYEGESNINTTAFWPKPYLNQSQNDKNRQASTRYLLDASFVRVQNIQIGYVLPSSVLNKYNMKGLRLYLSCENPLTLTKLLKGIDPVAIAGFGGGAGTTYGADKVFSMGLTISL